MEIHKVGREGAESPGDQGGGHMSSRCGLRSSHCRTQACPQPPGHGKSWQDWGWEAGRLGETGVVMETDTRSSELARSAFTRRALE